MTELVEGEVELTDGAEDIYRQVHPNFLDPESGITSQVFELNSQDEGKFSVSRSTLVTGEEATADYLEAGNASCGAVILTVADANDEGGPVIDDSNARQVPKGHAYIDFRESGLSKGKSRRLKKAATARGWAFRV